MKPMKIAMIGVGSISGIYLENITKRFGELELVGVCDLIRERAENARAKYNIPKLYEKMEDAFADPEVDIILNLTRPYQHYGVTKPALLAGKNVYSEKPLGASYEEGVELVSIAREKKLSLGGAPDTFLGAGIRTCRSLIDSGAIGVPVSGAAYMLCHGHETWHPDPEFYYKYGGGPMLDMGPYYITALINLLGGVHRVCGVTRTTFAQRKITSQPHNGDIIDVDVPTHIMGIMEFGCGAPVSIVTSFDVYEQFDRCIEIYGTEGTMIVPDPNGFGGPIRILKPGKGFEEYPVPKAYDSNSRALGLADTARAIANHREARCDCSQTLHVLEIMTSFHKSSESGKFIDIQSRYTRKAPLILENQDEEKLPD